MQHHPDQSLCLKGGVYRPKETGNIFCRAEKASHYSLTPDMVDFEG
jgi:hypothetical protein